MRKEGEAPEEVVLAVEREYIFQNLPIDPPQKVNQWPISAARVNSISPRFPPFPKPGTGKRLGFRTFEHTPRVFNMYAVERGLFTTYYSILLTSEYVCNSTIQQVVNGCPDKMGVERVVSVSVVSSSSD